MLLNFPLDAALIVSLTIFTPERFTTFWKELQWGLKARVLQQKYIFDSFIATKKINVNFDAVDIIQE